MGILTPSLSIIFFFVLILSLLLMIYFITKVWKRKDLEQATKIMWTVFFVLVPIPGIICYLLFGIKPNYTNANS